MTNKPVKKTHKKIDSVKRRNRKINNSLVISLCVLSIFIIVFFVFNIVTVAMKKEASGKNNSLSAETNKTMRNDQYEIGNNPTAIQKEYFQALTDAVKSSDNKKIAEEVVYNFVADYFTWTNKDGNYDIGGMQYIYSPKQSDFETYTLYNFYKDMDLYLSKDGRSSLIEVKKVTINNVSRVDDYTVTYTDENGDEQSAGLPCVNVEASWEYDSDTKMNASEIQTSATFHVVNNNDRWEIGGIE